MSDSKPSLHDVRPPERADIPLTQIISFRRALPEDVPDLLELQAATFEAGWHDTAETIERYIRSCACVVARAYERIIGSAVGYMSGADYHLYAVEVLPWWQRRGLACALVNLVLQAAEEDARVTAVAATEAGRALLAQFPKIVVVEMAPPLPPPGS